MCLMSPCHGYLVVTWLGWWQRLMRAAGSSAVTTWQHSRQVVVEGIEVWMVVAAAEEQEAGRTWACIDAARQQLVT
jgi:hypothetical protein